VIPGETVLSGAKHPGTKPEVMYSPHGYYVGFKDKDGTPYSRETDYINEDAATLILQLLRT